MPMSHSSWTRRDLLVAILDASRALEWDELSPFEQTAALTLRNRAARELERRGYRTRRVELLETL
jgi:hypothetical protein